MNPNEMRGSDLDEGEGQESCPNCGRDAKEWSARRGQGYRKDDLLYCCEGCGDGIGCTCEDVDELGADERKTVTTTQLPSDDQPSGLSGIGAEESEKTKGRPGRKRK